MKKVLVVDDSALVRKVLGEEISKFPDFSVVGSAIDPYDAREKIFQLNPDILTLDLEMPRMDGLSFLAKLMKFHPMPVVVVSSQAQEGSRAAMVALQLGAVGIVPKPGSQFSVPDVAHNLIHALRAAATVSMEKLQMAASASKSERIAPAARLLKTTHKVVAIGASTGGTQAVEVLMREMPADAPGTVIVQHMPEAFTGAFADRLNKICAMEVREAHDLDDVMPGHVLIAPGDKHMVLVKNGARYQVRIKDGPRVHFQRPSVDVLFQSVAVNSGQNAIGVILTGMGADGAKGMLAMHQQGAHTIAQDEKSCVIFGMPKEAIEMGGVDEVLPLSKITAAILNRVSSSSK
ncbi:MAG: chemotaxis response regulator protein-glutamate methylesterase [Acidobacteriota bacterium]|jgi:two-component system chemotaxis response regulator CheB|nr:chemotaxis response regulator protein-glutamate methylesterase [Acidobacteriota bacterium]